MVIDDRRSEGRGRRSVPPVTDHCRTASDLQELLMRLQRILKNAVNSCLLPLHRRIENTALIPNDVSSSLRNLAKAGFVPSQIADIGAARGNWTKEMLPLFPGSDFWLADPLEENRTALGTLASVNPRVKIWLGAIGDRVGSLDLHIHADQTSCFASEWGGDSRSVRMATLDALIEEGELHSPDLVKLDVQGAEMMIIEGARKALGSAKVVQMEVSFRQVYEGAPLAHEVAARMAALGFRIYDICGLIKRKRDDALLQADIIFARQGAWFTPEKWA